MGGRRDWLAGRSAAAGAAERACVLAEVALSSPEGNSVEGGKLSGAGGSSSFHSLSGLQSLGEADICA